MADLFPGATLIQLQEWGFPMGAARPVPPADKAFSVIHITGNSRLPSAENEAAWRLNDPGLQNSATFFVNRDGSVVQTLGEPLRMAPWANGDVQSPDTSNPRIAAVLRDGVNANQRTLVAIENVGFEPGASITRAQEATNARIIAHYHAKAGVPVSRETVIGHYQINGVNRPNCPGVNKALIDRIVALAQPEEDDMAWIANVKALTPYISVLGKNPRVRNEPSLNSSKFDDRPDGEEIVVVGAVQGDVANGSNRWLVYQSTSWGFGVTHESNEVSKKPLAGGDPAAFLALQLQAASLFDQIAQSATAAATQIRAKKP